MPVGIYAVSSETLCSRDGNVKGAETGCVTRREGKLSES
jgi:hypothetical protein